MSDSALEQYANSLQDRINSAKEVVAKLEWSKRAQAEQNIQTNEPVDQIQSDIDSHNAFIDRYQSYLNDARDKLGLA